MIELTRRNAVKAMIVLSVTRVEVVRAGDWTEPVEVRSNEDLCVSYRARLDGSFLVLRATLEPAWHTFTMDNKLRAEEKLAGRRSLGIDRPTEIKLTGGLEVAGRWYQSAPKDFSRPELRWFSWGFEREALFVAKVRRSGAEAARISVRGQACTEVTCKEIDVEISLPLAGLVPDANPSGVSLKNLVPVR